MVVRSSCRCRRETRCHLEYLTENRVFLASARTRLQLLGQFFQLVGSMLAFRCSRLRILPKAALFSAPNPRNACPASSACASVTNRFNALHNFGPSYISRSSSSSKSAVKFAGGQSRHAEITAYVERLNAQDVQVRCLLFSHLVP